MGNVRWLKVPCHACGEELNTWDVRVSHALGYKHVVCERCVAKEYDKTVAEVRDIMEENFGMKCTVVNIMDTELKDN